MKITKRQLIRLIRESFISEGMLDDIKTGAADHFRGSPVLQTLGVVDSTDYDDKNALEISDSSLDGFPAIKVSLIADGVVAGSKTFRPLLDSYGMDPRGYLDRDNRLRDMPYTGGTGKDSGIIPIMGAPGMFSVSEVYQYMAINLYDILAAGAAIAEYSNIDQNKPLVFKYTGDNLDTLTTSLGFAREASGVGKRGGRTFKTSVLQQWTKKQLPMGFDEFGVPRSDTYAGTSATSEVQPEKGKTYFAYEKMDLSVPLINPLVKLPVELNDSMLSMHVDKFKSNPREFLSRIEVQQPWPALSSYKMDNLTLTALGLNNKNKEKSKVVGDLDEITGY